jgi:hypothetical protein
MPLIIYRSPDIIYLGEEIPDKITKSIYFGLFEETDWIERGLSILKDHNFDGTIFIPVPRSKRLKFSDNDIINWKQKCLEVSDKILYWSDKQELLTSNDQNLINNIKENNKVIFGSPKISFFGRKENSKKYLKMESILDDKYKNSLNEILEYTLEYLGDGSEREEDERKIPLSIWNSKNFKCYYESLEKENIKSISKIPERDELLFKVLDEDEKEIDFVWSEGNQKFIQEAILKNQKEIEKELKENFKESLSKAIQSTKSELGEEIDNKTSENRSQFHNIFDKLSSKFSKRINKEIGSLSDTYDALLEKQKDISLKDREAIQKITNKLIEIDENHSNQSSKIDVIRGDIESLFEKLDSSIESTKDYETFKGLVNELVEKQKSFEEHNKLQKEILREKNELIENYKKDLKENEVYHEKVEELSNLKEVVFEIQESIKEKNKEIDYQNSLIKEEIDKFKDLEKSISDLIEQTNQLDEKILNQNKDLSDKISLNKEEIEELKNKKIDLKEDQLIKDLFSKDDEIEKKLKEYNETVQKVKDQQDLYSNERFFEKFSDDVEEVSENIEEIKKDLKKNREKIETLLRDQGRFKKELFNYSAGGGGGTTITGVSEAPSDGKTYGRKDGDWVEIVLTPGGSASDTIGFSFGGNKTHSNSYLATAGDVDSNSSGYVVPWDATITKITVNTPDVETWVAEVRNEAGTVITSSSLTAQTKKVETVSQSVLEGEVIRLFVNGSGIRRPLVTVFLEKV